ncbi:unnamed protein product, partial [Amoebophrya sp. A25]
QTAIIFRTRGWRLVYSSNIVGGLENDLLKDDPSLGATAAALAKTVWRRKISTTSGPSVGLG